jgi:hypothetical protein
MRHMPHVASCSMKGAIHRCYRSAERRRLISFLYVGIIKFPPGHPAPLAPSGDLLSLTYSCRLEAILIAVLHYGHLAQRSEVFRCVDNNSFITVVRVAPDAGFIDSLSFTIVEPTSTSRLCTMISLAFTDRS